MVYRGLNIASAGIYCCVPYIRDDDQTSLVCRERLCRDRAAALGLSVSARSVFVDERRAVWKREGKRPGWEALLAAVKAGAFASLLLHRPGMLLHRSWDVLELLDVCADRQVVLHGVADAWNLVDAAERSRFHSEAERVYQASLSAAVSARATHENAAAAGRPHGGGRRAYGYEAGMGALVPSEASIVREVFTRYLAGETLRAIAWDLNVRGVVNTGGGEWFTSSVARLLEAPRYAGLRVLRGQVVRDADGGYLAGAWEPCVSVKQWEQAQAMRASRAAAYAENRRPARPYLLTGIVQCENCVAPMVGTVVGTYRMYACSSTSKPVARRCKRHVGAESLERFVQGEAIRLLEAWDSRNVDALPVAVPREPFRGDENRGRAGAHSADEAGLHAVIVRSGKALDGVHVGPSARLHWKAIPTARKAAVLRFLFASIKVGPKTAGRGTFDCSRIELVLNTLQAT